MIQVVLGTKVGRVKHMRIMPGGALESEQESGSVFVGPKLEEHRGAFLLEYPMDKGIVLDNGWDAMEKLWEVSLFFPYLALFFYKQSSHCSFHKSACILETMSQCKARRTSCSYDRSSSQST
jgi:hypothetical protein